MVCLAACEGEQRVSWQMKRGFGAVVGFDDGSIHPYEEVYKYGVKEYKY